MAVPMPTLRPSPGFCLQAESGRGQGAKWYLNMCKHRVVEMPLAPNGKPVDREHILSRGLGNLQVPFDMGTFRKLKQRADGAKRSTYCVDIVFSPLIIQLFMDDSFCNSMENYRQFVMNLAINRVEQTIGVKLVATTIQLVKSIRYKDGEDGDDSTPREFAEIAGEVDGELGADEIYPKKSAAPQPPAKETLIEDVTAPRKQRPAVKKGFLNGRKETQSLYPENGSGEGVLPENAGDPMGWMPKKLRGNSKIIDCNSPDYQAYEKQKKAADATNKMNAEFKEMLSKDLASFDKFNKPDKWAEDLPDGTDAPSKYSVDYSRFASIPDEDGDVKTEDRDWYYDTDGVRRQMVKQAPAVTTVGGGDGEDKNTVRGEPAVRKGFLNDSKGSLYPSGSEQASAREPPSEAEMMRQLQSIMGDMNMDMSDMGDLANLLPGGLEGQNEAVEQGLEQGKQKLAMKRREMKAAEFTLTSVAEDLQLVVSVPGLTSMRDVNLDVTERRASLVFPTGCDLRPLEVELPKRVAPNSVKAKFSKKTQQITITLPMAT